jgi:hypothetical protein
MLLSLQITQRRGNFLFMDTKLFGSGGVVAQKLSDSIKSVERFDTNFVTHLWGLLASISEEQKTNARKLSIVF